jgi:NitT/TauT family transport system substrate-binding protein
MTKMVYAHHWGGPIRLLMDNNQQPNSSLVIFCEVVQRDPFFLVGREPNVAFQLTALVDARVSTVSGVQTPWLCLQHDMRLAGLDPVRARRAPDRSMPENLAALRAGDIDVMQAFQPVRCIVPNNGSRRTTPPNSRPVWRPIFRTLPDAR